MKAKLNRPLIKAASMILPGILIASLTLANGEREMQIDIETDDIRIEQMDIDHLEVGDSETIYTTEGKAVDVLRTEQGVEIFIDGEKLDMPFLHGNIDVDGEHELHKYVIMIECDDEQAEDCAEGHHGIGSEHGQTGIHEDHELIIIKKIDQGEDEV